MSKTLRAAVLAAMLLTPPAPCAAAEASAVPETKRTTLGLYLTSEEVPPFLARAGGRSLFVDVRTPAELASSGVAASVEANVPVIVPAGAARRNPEFVAGVEAALTARGLSKADPVVTICRTGRRSALAADLLAEAGFTRVYSVIDGFEGDGPGMKGWKAAGLPWRQGAPPKPE